MIQSTQTRLPGLLALTLTIFLVLLLAGCGFQLRGAVEVPSHLTPIYVDGGAGVRRALDDGLRANEVSIAAAPQQARLIIHILYDRHDARVRSVDEDGKIIAQDLLYEVMFEALSPDGQRLADPQTINLTRHFVNPEIEVLGKREEAELLRQDMEQDAAGRILVRLKAQLL